MSLHDLVDLHCHYVPAVDDGVRTEQEGLALCQGLLALGYTTVVATPHIRPGMFDNRKEGLLQSYGELARAAAGAKGMPALGLAAEHFCYDGLFELFERGEALPYPGAHAALIELPQEAVPLGLQQRFFRLLVHGVRPVIAHPERYTTSFRSSDAIEPLLEHGALALLDVMSLTGKYGRRARDTAERMLDEDLYYAACSDAHRPQDLAEVAQGIARLTELVGPEDAQAMLGDNPRSILEGTVVD